jgi:TRAP-type C4-dicarboxylate transport system substrate-binding protein
MGPGEIYESVQRGAIDGVGTFFFPTAYTFGIHEVAPHVVDAGSGFYASVGFIMNDEVWSSLPSDIQAIFDDVSDELMAGKAIEIYEEASQAACDGFIEAGGSITIFSEDQVSDWREDVLPGMVEEWKQNVVDNTDLTEEDAELFRSQFLDTYQRNAAASEHAPDAEACAAQQS